MLTVLMILVFSGSAGTRVVQAARNVDPTATPLPAVESGAPAPSQNNMHSSDCLTCHGQRNFTGTLGDGIKVNLTIDAEVAKTNLHYRLGTCSLCHVGFDGYPHPNTKAANCSRCHFNDKINQEINVSLPFENSRALVVEMNNRCYTCHSMVFIAFVNGSHAKIMNSGNLSAPVCSDCHGSHSIQPVAKTDSSQSCARCHEATYSSFMSSVHGAELGKKSPADAPTCADCHGTHTLNGPSNPDFRKNSVAVCLKCHQDKTMMDRYNFPSDTFDTSVDNYHTVKVDVLGRQDFNVTGNTPVCIDCHGVHSIRAGTDQGSSVSPTNLLGTCLKCHFGQTGFTVAGRAHFSSSSVAIKAVKNIENFFGYFIPFIGGLLGVYILLDARKLWFERKKPTGQNQ